MGGLFSTLFGGGESPNPEGPTQPDEKPSAQLAEIEPKPTETKPQEQTPVNTQAETAKPPETQAPARKKIDRSIYVQKEKTDETILRIHGEINGNQFCADRLTRCKVIVKDFVDSMTLDRCEDCEFLLSAVRGSIFARNCKNCKFAMVCGQFRCRDCVDCKFFMQVKTGPVIESSQNLSIGCAEVSYPELLEHMNKSKLDRALNVWCDIHDFTPGEGHYSLLSGEKLEMDILENGEPILPFTYALDKTKSRILVTLANEHMDAIAKRSYEDLKLVNINRVDDGHFSIELQSSENEVKSALSAFEPLQLTRIDE